MHGKDQSDVQKRKIAVNHGEERRSTGLSGRGGKSKDC